MQKIKKGEAQWKELFKKIDFFKVYPMYLEIRT